MSLRPAQAESDAAAIVSIYNYYIRESAATFEEEELSIETMKARIQAVTQSHWPWLVVEREQGRIEGYAYATAWHERAAYRHSAEATIYLSPDALSQGVGSQLLGALLETLRKNTHHRVHLVFSAVTLPNDACARLHSKFGFKQAGFYPGAGRKFQRWRDTAIFLLPLIPREAIDIEERKREREVDNDASL
jgi:L-amino acid N-acyltransferase YncA